MSDVQNPLSGAEAFIDEALKKISGYRDGRTGPSQKERNFKPIAQLWTFWLRKTTDLDLKVSEIDVAMMMTLLKVARIAERPTHLDSYVDVIGYAANAAEIAASLPGPSTSPAPAAPAP